MRRALYEDWFEIAVIGILFFLFVFPVQSALASLLHSARAQPPFEEGGRGNAEHKQQGKIWLCSSMRKHQETYPDFSGSRLFPLRFWSNTFACSCDERCGRKRPKASD